MRRVLLAVLALLFLATASGCSSSIEVDADVSADQYDGWLDIVGPDDIAVYVPFEWEIQSGEFEPVPGR